MAVVVVWAAIGFRLLGTRAGREYLRSNSAVLAEDNTRTQPNNLTIAGLVFAGLAFSQTASIAPEVTAVLTASLSAFLAGWAVLYIPSAMAATFMADAMHWIGLALLLAAVFAIGEHSASEVAQMASGAAAATILAMSMAHANGHRRTAIS